MNKQELIKAIAADTGMTQTAVGAVLNAFQAQVTTALTNGEEVNW